MFVRWLSQMLSVDFCERRRRDSLLIPSKARWQRLRGLAFLAAATVTFPAFAPAQNVGGEVCPRAAAGSMVAAPQEIRSHNGVLRIALSLRNSVGPAGEQRYCYVDENGNQAPTLRLKPGDLLILKLKNELSNTSTSMEFTSMDFTSRSARSLCLSGPMTASSTNLHFHGLMIPPTCHEDDVIRTTIPPGAPSFEYRFRIPRTQPPGLYWYHPHPHGHSEEQVLGGASGALIVEGIELFNGLAAGLPERLLVIRDQIRPIAGPNAAPKPPSKDLSVNFTPVAYPDYPLAVIKTKPLQRELWRVLNASADTSLDLRLLSNGKWQSMGLVALDGVPLSYEEMGYEGNGKGDRIRWTFNIPLSPGGRAEFLFDSPTEGEQTQLFTDGVDTVPFQDEDEPSVVTPAVVAPAFVAPAGSNAQVPDDDDYTPPRWLAKVVSVADAPEAASIVPKASSHAERPTLPPLMSARPTHRRKLYFSEETLDPKNRRASTIFYITEEGRRPSAFNPAAAPNITVRQGDVEDWVIENRSQETHTFHIHQTHFIVLERGDKAVEENYLRDTVALPYWDGVSPRYPSVKLRMDFRDPAIAGTFPYHCHILQHEDGGMMGTIRVLKSSADK